LKTRSSRTAQFAAACACADVLAPIAHSHGEATRRLQANSLWHSVVATDFQTEIKDQNSRSIAERTHLKHAGTAGRNFG
jgi:hypothetical protein